MYIYSEPFTLIRHSGETKLIAILKGVWMGLTHKRPSFHPTGTHLFRRSVSVWGLAFSSSSLSLISAPAHFTRWSLTVNTARYHSVVTHGGPSLAQKLPNSPTATWKGSMLWLINGPPRQELVSLPTKKTIARAVTLELELVPEGILITSTRVETKQGTGEIMEKNTLQPWGTSWCSDKESYEQPLNHALCAPSKSRYSLS